MAVCRIKPGIAAAKIFKARWPRPPSNVDMIVQNVSHGIREATRRIVYLARVEKADLLKAQKVIEGLKAKVGYGSVISDESVAKVSIVGVGMRSHTGIASTMFRTLAEEGINIQMISTSEIKVSVLIDEKYLELGVRVLHKAFGLDQPQ